MRIVVNGTARTCAEGLTVADLLAEMGLSANAIVVERNADILQRSAYVTTTLSEGDSLELIQFVGGG
jgi:thiamine biosynthesis protein ThiS